MYAEVTIPKGASLGVHRHTGNAESYYILAGTGLYTDDGKPMKSMRATRHTAPMAITTDLKYGRRRPEIHGAHHSVMNLL